MDSQAGPQTGDDARRYRGLFVALQVIGGQFGLPLFIGTMLLARSVKRHLILANFCASWIVYSLAYTLSVYAGGEPASDSPSALCIAQTSLVFGVVPLTVTTYCALHTQIWLGLRTALYENTWATKYQGRILVAMFYAPYVVFISFTLGTLAVCLRDPKAIDRTETYYCTLGHNGMKVASPAYAAAVIAFMLALELHMAITIIPRWRVVRRTKAISRASLTMLARICIFSIYGIVTLAACAAFITKSSNFWPYLVQASLPTAIFCVFGTRGDVWSAWCFWRDPGGEEAIKTTRSENVTLDSQISLEKGNLKSPDIPPKVPEKD